MNTSCREIENLFQSYRKKNLTKDERKLFENHIKTCHRCHQAYERDIQIAEKLETIPILSCPKTVVNAIKSATYKRFNHRDIKKKIRNYLFHHKSLSISFATIIVVLCLIVIKSGFDKNGTPGMVYSMEEIAKARAQTKWSLAFTAKTIRQTEEQIIEDVLLKKLPGKMKQSIIEIIPIITGGQE